MTNGSIVKIGYTGTTVAFKPGTLIGGKVEHDCGQTRSIGYFLEPLLMLAPFAKQGFQLTLLGITNDNVDVSVDTLRTVALPQLARYGVEEGLELKVNKRGAPPEGGGQVFFRCVPVRALKPINMLDEGRIKRIRGIAYSTRVSPQTANRVVESARSILNQFIPDVFIHTDHYKGSESGKYDPFYYFAKVDIRTFSSGHPGMASRSWPNRRQGRSCQPSGTAGPARHPRTSVSGRPSCSTPR